MRLTFIFIITKLGTGCTSCTSCTGFQRKLQIHAIVVVFIIHLSRMIGICIVCNATQKLAIHTPWYLPLLDGELKFVVTYVYNTALLRSAGCFVPLIMMIVW